MSRASTIGVLAGLAAMVACSEPPPAAVDSNAAASSVATLASGSAATSVASASSSVDWGTLEEPPTLPVEPPPMEASPLASSAPEGDRAGAVLALLAGGEPASRLPIRATDTGKSFDPMLRQKLAPAAKPPTIRMLTMTASPGLPKEVIQRIVRQNFGRFRLCYETELLTNPNLQGKVTVSFSIDATGATKSVKGGGEMPSITVVNCVTKQFQGLTFPQPEGGRVVQVTYPILFSPAT